MAKKLLDWSAFASLGGKALAKSRTKAERSDAARKAVKARWAKAKKLAVALLLLGLHLRLV